MKKTYLHPTTLDSPKELIPKLISPQSLICTTYITIDLNTRSVKIAGTEIDFRMAEFKLFCLFTENINKTLLYEQIEEALWKSDSYSSRNAIHKQVQRIREMIKPFDSLVEIVNRSSCGYKMVEDQKLTRYQ